MTPRLGDDDWVDAYEESLDSAQAGRRPRSKQRPAHSDAAPGMVIGVDRGRYDVVLNTSEATKVRANRARELRNTAIVVGDRVDVVGDVTGQEGTLARIVRVQERDNVLRRSADDTDQFERVIVANADYLLMVVATADPEPRPRLIDRYVIAALDAGIDPILCVTKADVHPADWLRDYAAQLDIPVVVLRTDGEPDDENALRELLGDRTTVAVGHSGVGKSTLVNRLVPSAHRDVGVVNVVTGRGRHTSSSSRALELPGGGWIIDTPGVRSFGLGHVTPEAIDRGFSDLQPFLELCPRGCGHSESEPDCALHQAVADGRLSARQKARAESLVRLRGLAVEHSGHGHASEGDPRLA
ncbi:ribosome biogenesis GTPase RsgA [Pontimonas salivibrio]|uniref:Small ribosomal subunit biogenesis GTPase RsgA n=1 Tax=Pontimonas salivibrio TaxID=1159327 RepID=A0A2L2BS22_9MICO|nr:ribosome small subunit-dependent GTPase A [Pontimonas salivibrio]AVG24412.1 ribosome biogenesis GTPase RsgA [Pontimonas salivibrio]